MIEQIKETEIEFMELFSDPTAMTECLIPENINSPQIWPNCNCITLRNYQFAMQNYSYLMADDNALSKKENLNLKQMAGNLYSIGARNLGKSLWLWIDTILTVVDKVKEACIASFDDQHLKKVTNTISLFVESHKFLRIFHLNKETSRSKTVKRSPFEIVTEHGSVVKGINEKVEGDNPGTAFHGLHFDYLNYEEFSYASDVGAKKRVDSGNSLGYIERLSGIPDLCIGSPMGKVLKNPKNKSWIWRLPQFVREDYSQEMHEKLAEEHGGEKSASFKLNVEAITLEGAYGFWDMARLKEASFKKNKSIKSFEIGKDNFQDFKSLIHVERLSGSEQVFIMADMGFNAAPTEIIIVFFDGKKYTYSYNITLYRLVREEQAAVFYWLYQKLRGGFIGIDATSDDGETLEYVYKLGVPKSHLLKIKLNSNIETGFQRDDEDNIILDKSGVPLMQLENARQFAFQELEKIMYGGTMIIPFDEKFLNQFTSTIAKQTKGMKTIYENKSSADHLHSAFEIFAICRFLKEFEVIKGLTQTKRAFCS